MKVKARFDPCGEQWTWAGLQNLAGGKNLEDPLLPSALARRR